MISITHLDGTDVVVIDAQGREVPAVSEARVEADRAVVAVSYGARNWLQSLLTMSANDSFSCVIRSRDGRLHWRGPARLAYV